MGAVSTRPSLRPPPFRGPSFRKARADHVARSQMSVLLFDRYIGMTWFAMRGTDAGVRIASRPVGAMHGRMTGFREAIQGESRRLELLRCFVVSWLAMTEPKRRRISQFGVAGGEGAHAHIASRRPASNGGHASLGPADESACALGRTKQRHARWSKFDRRTRRRVVAAIVSAMRSPIGQFIKF